MTAPVFPHPPTPELVDLLEPTEIEERLAARDRRRHEAQRAAATALAEARQRHADAIADAAAAEAEASGAVRDAEARLAHAAERLEAARRATYQAGLSRDREIGRLEAAVRELAHPALVAFDAELGRLEETTRRHPIEDARTVLGPRNPIALTRPVELWSNAPLIARRLDAIRAARRRLAELVLEPLGADDAARLIADLRAGIPDVPRGAVESLGEAAVRESPSR